MPAHELTEFPHAFRLGGEGWIRGHFRGADLRFRSAQFPENPRHQAGTALRLIIHRIHHSFGISVVQTVA
jgi:hypothetical protein